MSCTTRRPLGPPLLNQRISRFHVPYRHYNMSTSLRKLPANSYNNKYKLKRFTLLFPLTPTKRSNTTSKAKGNLCFLFRDLAVSEPMPLVEPMTMHLFFLLVTMHLKWFNWGRGIGLCKWEKSWFSAKHYPTSQPHHPN